MLVVCAWCGRVLGTKPSLGQSGVSHGICLDCEKKYFAEKAGKVVEIKRGEHKRQDNS